MVLFEFMLLGEKPARDLESSTLFSTSFKSSQLQKSRNPKLTPQTIRNLFTWCTSRRCKLVPTKTAPWAVLDNLEAVIGPHEKGAGTGNHYKSQKKSLSKGVL